MKQFLGIDYGAARVGLARAEDSGVATAWQTVAPSELAETIRGGGPFDTIVVGLPRGLDGQETPQTLAVRRFTADVLEPLGTELVFQDEAATSSVAEERLRESGRDFTKADIDAEAAAIILQDWLDAR